MVSSGLAHTRVLLGSFWKGAGGIAGARVVIDEEAATLYCFRGSEIKGFTLDGDLALRADLGAHIPADSVCAVNCARNRMCFMDRASSRISVCAFGVDDSLGQTHLLPRSAGAVGALCFGRDSHDIIVASLKDDAKTAGSSSLVLSKFVLLATGAYAFLLPISVTQDPLQREQNTTLAIAADEKRDCVWVAETCSKRTQIRVVPWYAPLRASSLILPAATTCFLLTNAAIEGVLVVADATVLLLDEDIRARNEWQLPRIDDFDGPPTSVAYHGPTAMLYVAAGASLRAMTLDRSLAGCASST